jgi:hypothetical protein
LAVLPPRTRYPLALAFAVAVAVFAPLAAGCGGSSSPGVASIGTSTNASASRPSWAAFYHCFAAHGYPNYREIGSPSSPSAPPINGWYRKANGNYVVTPDFMKLYDTAKFRAVERVCDSLDPSPRATPAQVARGAAQARKFSRCARAHGMPDFPDPDNQGFIHLDAAGISYESPEFQHVKRACQSLIKTWRASAGYLYGGPKFLGG